MLSHGTLWRHFLCNGIQQRRSQSCSMQRRQQSSARLRTDRSVPSISPEKRRSAVGGESASNISLSFRYAARTRQRQRRPTSDRDKGRSSVQLRTTSPTPPQGPRDERSAPHWRSLRSKPSQRTSRRTSKVTDEPNPVPWQRERACKTSRH